MKILERYYFIPYFILLANSVEFYLDPLAKSGGDGSLSRPLNNFSDLFGIILKESKFYNSSIVVTKRIALSITEDLIDIGGEYKKIEIFVKGASDDNSLLTRMDFPRILVNSDSSFKIVNMQIALSDKLISASEANFTYMFFAGINGSIFFEVKNKLSLPLTYFKFFKNITFLYQRSSDEGAHPTLSVVGSGRGSITLNSIQFLEWIIPNDYYLILIKEGTFSLKDMSFSNITVESTFSLMIQGGIGQISNFTFTKNALNFKGIGKVSALLYVSKSTVNIELLKFEQNTISAKGGSLAYFENINSITIKKLNISSNFMQHQVAIKFKDISENLVLFDSIVINNYEINAVVVNNVSNYYFENFLCLGNSKYSCETAHGCSCLSISKSINGKLVASVFRDNCASWAPSGVNIEQTAISNFVLMVSVIFEENSSLYYDNANYSSMNKGTSIYIRDSLNLSIFYSLFKGNIIDTDSVSTTHGSGPALYFETEATSASVFSTMFIGNGAVSRSNCINANSITKLIIENCTFLRNKPYAKQSNRSLASGVYCGAVDILLIKNVIVQENTANLQGILTFYSKEPTSLHKVIIENSLFMLNTGVYSGVFFFLFEEYNLRIEKSIFFKNRAEKGSVVGGGFVSNTFQALFNECQFFLNEAQKEGGVGHIANIGGSYKFESCYFFKNKAQKGGVFIYVATIDSPIIISNCILSNNQATRRGGISAISSGTIIDSFSVYINNSARNEGGVHILENNALVEINGSVLLKSNSGYIGGIAVLMEENSFIINGGSLVIESRAMFGACLVANTMSKLGISNATFIFNEADWGTLIYLANCIYMSEISQILVFRNRADRGALIHIVSSNIKAIEINFLHNQAGVFIMTNSYSEISKIEFNYHYCDEVESLKACLLFIAENSRVNLTAFSYTNVITATGIPLIKTGTSIMFLSEGKLILTGFHCDEGIIIMEFSNSTLQGLSFEGLENTGVLCKNGFLILRSINIEKLNVQLETAVFTCLFCRDFQLIDSNLLNINSTFLRGNILLLGQTSGKEFSLFLISNCTFYDNYGVNGAALFIENARAKVLNCKFNRNFASQKGGAIHLKNAFTINNSITYKTSIINCSFSGNYAFLSGGALYWEGEEPLGLLKNTFSNNKAPHGTNIASGPAYLRPSVENPIKITSGETVEKPLIFYLVDVYYQIIKHESNITATIFSNEGLDKLDSKRIDEIKGVLNEQTAEMLEGQFSFFSVALISTPGKQNKFFVKSPIIGSNYQGVFNRTSIFDAELEPYPLPFEDKINPKDNMYYLSFALNFRDCVVGEIFIPELNVCKKCPSGQYSISLDDSLCRDCPIQAKCAGGAQMTILPGYWRQNSSSLNFYLCDMGCVGGEGENLCHDGYGGPLCASCVYDSESKYFKINDVDCEICESFSGKSIFFVFVFKLFLIISLLLFFVITNIRAQNFARKSVSLRKKSHLELIQIRIERKQLNALLKQFINYLQIFSIISKLKIKWPDSFLSLNSTSSFITNYTLLTVPIDCLLLELGAKINYPLMMMKIIIGLILFYSMIIITILFWILYRFLLRKQSIQNEILSSILIPIYLFQPAIVNLLITPLKCRSIEGRKYISAYVNVPCDDDFYSFTILPIVAPNLVIWMILAPTALFIYIKQNKLEIYTTAKYYTCDFLINGYEQKYFFWEFLHLINKYSVIIVTNFVLENLVAAILSFLILNIFLLIEISYKPYRKNNLNTISILAQSANLINISAGIFFGTDIGTYAYFFLFVTAIIFNSVFLIIWGKNFFSVVLVRIAALLRVITSKICPKKVQLQNKKDGESKVKMGWSLKPKSIKIRDLNKKISLSNINSS